MTTKRKRGKAVMAAPRRGSSVAALQRQLERQARELDRAREERAAIAEVLRVISASPGDLETVFRALLENATRICKAKFGILYRFDGEAFHFVAEVGTPLELVKFNRRRSPFQPTPGAILERVLRTKQVSYTADDAAAAVPSAPARLGGARSFVCVPMLKDDVLIGAISIYRQEVRPFTDKQIALVQNFAAQAVIAIENARLLNDLRQRTADLTESLEQQTATSNVLEVISTSPGELEPTFNAMLESAARICEARNATIFLRDGDVAVTRAQFGSMEGTPIGYRTPLILGVVLGRSILEARTINVTDLANSEDFLEGRERARRYGHRATLAVPLVRGGIAIGTIVVRRPEPRPFNNKQIELVTNFAAQAVIAIENARLLNELRESLEQQTATAEVLKVISRSTFDLEVVLKALIESAARLCHADKGSFRLVRGEFFHHAASYGYSAEQDRYMDAHPVPAEGDRGSIVGRVLDEGRVVQVEDTKADPEFKLTNVPGFESIQTTLGVPLLREGRPIGVLVLMRTRVERFSEKQVELVTTFADQAVIAIENARLLNELRESLQQQTATADVLKVISRSTFDLQVVLTTLVESAARLCEANIASIALPSESGFFRAQAHFGISPAHMELMEHTPIKAGRGSAIGRVLQEKTTIHILDAQTDPDYELLDVRKLGEFHTMLGVPLLREGAPIGVFVLMRRIVRPFTDKQMELATTFADQAGIAIENVRLFDEIQEKSRQLEIASQHKSQFVANMSHELRTPLAAILGYAELMEEGIYEPLEEKSLAALARIRSNGKHLLGLINSVLDIAKIESGQFTLNMTEYSIETVVETVRVATESLAQNKKLALTTAVPKSLPIGIGDEQRLTQVLLNLVGNAIKFTDTGEVRVTAEAVDGHFAIRVVDTGPGIPAQERTRIFEQFHQIDDSNTKTKGGTGLGLAIAKQIVEMHGGRIWVDSTVGKGSTFQMELPIRAEKMIA